MRDVFGIGILQACKAHERYVEAALAQAHTAGYEELKALYDCHNLRLTWLAHERLIHLLVTALTGVFFLFLIGLALFLPGTPSVLVLTALVFLLFAAYLFHYFRLENTVQHWYRLSDEIYRKILRARAH